MPKMRKTRVVREMDGNTFIGGITSHREQFWCERCGHIQWASYTSSDHNMCDYKDHIKCEICGNNKMKSKSDIEFEIVFLPSVIHMTKRTGKDPKQFIGELARWKNIIQQMELRKCD